MTAVAPRSLLNHVTCPDDLRALSLRDLEDLAAEIRRFLVASVSRTGGHLGPNLGVVELTIALHRVFESPVDTLLWDTGHQAYVHKLLTGRRAGFGGLRQSGGLSGYPCQAESVHDVIENSHASTALSYADGLAKARALAKESYRSVVAVVGDGALTGGMSWEALNNIGGSGQPVIVVLNDNGRSYDPTVGGIADHLTRLRTATSASPLFTALGFAYLGPVDGHDVAQLEPALRQARNLPGPVVVHCVTTKGMGFPAAEAHEADRMHAVSPSDARYAPTWTSAFGDELAAIGLERDDVVAVTAAMLRPVGLEAFWRAHPDRTFDVGIAEQHAVASAAGLALGGLHPVVAVYAAFLNRAFDQILMDVALHRLGVTFVLDRAGITGDDGPSHNGMWDLSLLQLVPGIRIAAPRDGASLRTALREAVNVSDAPTVLRFPKAPLEPDIPSFGRAGLADLLRIGRRADVLVVSVGATAPACLELAAGLGAAGRDVTVVDPRWVIPVDDVLVELAGEHAAVVTVEDNGAQSGIGGAVGQAMRRAGVATPLYEFAIPQRFQPVAKRAALLSALGLDGPGLTESVLRSLGHDELR
ncbi:MULTISPECIES: 1-deoxy-D-xylulose-5-phosphate synthase [Amycolatopsis]|uniref:1-deoxy-D-xylulose-5-phosphate synthase n=1 Tax=Amycolatopsis albidoflavus TaxID=102226 RepID=A0ABW5I8R5_9PSEU